MMTNNNETDLMGQLNRLLERLHQTGGNGEGSLVLNIYEKGSFHVDHVDSQIFYGDNFMPKKTSKADGPPAAAPVFDIDTPLSALFRENHHKALESIIDSWRPYLIGDDPSVNALAITQFKFDKKQIYSNHVYYDLLDLDALGALQVPLSQLASYLADHTNLSQSYDTLYRQLKKYRQERP